MALWKENLGFKTLSQINNAKLTVPNGLKLFGKQLIKDSFGLSLDYSNYFMSDKKHLAKSKSMKLAKTLNDQLSEDYNGKLKAFLKCEDRCSMAFGIESRVPFADDMDLVNLMFSLSGNLKIRDGVSKYLLREATKRFIPNQIYNRKDKIGFDTPIEKWFLPHKKLILSTIENHLNIVNIDYVSSNFEELLHSRPSFLLRLFSLSIWKSRYNNI